MDREDLVLFDHVSELLAKIGAPYNAVDVELVQGTALPNPERYMRRYISFLLPFIEHCLHRRGKQLCVYTGPTSFTSLNANANPRPACCGIGPVR